MSSWNRWTSVLAFDACETSRKFCWLSTNWEKRMGKWDNRKVMKFCVRVAFMSLIANCRQRLELGNIIDPNSEAGKRLFAYTVYTCPHISVAVWSSWQDCEATLTRRTHAAHSDTAIKLSRVAEPKTGRLSERPPGTNRYSTWALLITEIHHVRGNTLQRQWLTCYDDVTTVKVSGIHIPFLRIVIWNMLIGRRSEWF